MKFTEKWRVSLPYARAKDPVETLSTPMGEYGAVYGRLFFLDATKKTTTATAELG
jgi:hypothetical protein